MGFKAKLAAGLEILAGTDIGRFSYAPLLHRLLWKIGVPIPPPHFASFRSLFLFQCFFGGAFWGLFMWWAVWAKDGTPALVALGITAFFGVFSGLMTATFIRRRARKHNLPDWSEVSANVAERFD